MVRIFFVPTEVMKSVCTSTWFLAPQAATCFCMTALPDGTQWSQNATESLPAARPERMWTRGSAADAAASLSALRRETFPAVPVAIVDRSGVVTWRPSWLGVGLGQTCWARD